MSGGVDGPYDYYASVSGRYRDGYRDHSKENTELLFTDVGYKFSDNLENRFYLTLDQTDRELPGGLTQEQMQTDPQQADPDAVPMDFRKQWYYERIADKLTYQNDGQEFDAEMYYWHRDLKEKGDFDPNDYEQGIQHYNANDGGIDLNSVTQEGNFLGGEIFSRSGSESGV